MDWTSRIRAAFTASSRMPDDDVLEELAQHARAIYEAARAEGLSREAANARVTAQVDRWRLDAGALRHKSSGPTLVVAPSFTRSWWSGLAHDVRYGARLMRRQPRHTSLVTVIMALGIAVTTVLFSVTYGVLVKPLPWPHADRLVVLEETRGGNAPRFGTFSNATYLAWRESPATIDGIAGWAQRTVTLTGAGDPERIRITAASASLWSILGAHPLLGSLFDEGDELSTDGPVIVLSESLWRQRFGADPAVLGRLLHIDGQPHAVIGILQDALAFPDAGARAWVPFRIVPTTGNYLSMFDAIARLRPGATAALAAAEGTARAATGADTGLTTTAIFGSAGPVAISAASLREALTADVRQPLLALLIAVGLLLVTATANVVGLQLARATTRGRELAIRAALGAGAARVTRQLFVESLLLGLSGGAAGLAMAWLLHRSLPALMPADFPRLTDIGMDATVVMFAFALSVLASVAFGMLPALRLRTLDLVRSLADDGTPSAGAVRRSRIASVRAIVMAGQVAIACMLLVGASLLGRSFVALLEADRGFDPDGVLTARVSLPAALYTPERRHQMVGQMLQRLGTLPGVTSAGFTSDMPLSPGGSTAAFQLPSHSPGAPVVTAQASPRIVSPRALPALGIRVIAGRMFTESDTETSEPVVIVNRAFARRYLGDSPLEATLPMAVGHQGADAQARVIGVVEDVRYLTAADTSQPELYYSYRQFKGRLTVPVVTLLVRTAGDPASFAPALRMAVREADPNLVPEAVMTLQDRMLTSLAHPRLYAILLGGFAAIALIVANVGLFGVLSYSVAQRSRELAVRAALGARQIDIVRLVVGDGLIVAGVGLAAGLAGSIVLTRTIASLLYGVTPYDAPTYAMVPVVVLCTAAAACLAPARRAARFDPVQALRT